MERRDVLPAVLVLFVLAAIPYGATGAKLQNTKLSHIRCVARASKGSRAVHKLRLWWHVQKEIVAATYLWTLLQTFTAGVELGDLRQKPVHGARHSLDLEHDHNLRSMPSLRGDNSDLIFRTAALRCLKQQSKNTKHCLTRPGPRCSAVTMQAGQRAYQDTVHRCLATVIVLHVAHAVCAAGQLRRHWRGPLLCSPADSGPGL